MILSYKLFVRNDRDCLISSLSHTYKKYYPVTVAGLLSRGLSESDGEKIRALMTRYPQVRERVVVSLYIQYMMQAEGCFYLGQAQLEEWLAGQTIDEEVRSDVKDLAYEGVRDNAFEETEQAA